MKIALDLRSLFYTEKRTGVEEYIYQLAYHLPRIAPEDQFSFFYNSRADRPSLKKLFEPKNVTAVNFQRPNKLLTLTIRLFNAPKLTKLLGAKPDIVIIPSYRPIALDEGIKKVMVFHDLSFALSPELLSRKNRFWHWFLDIKKQAQNSDRLIAVSNSTKNDLIHHFQIASEKINVTPLGLSAPEAIAKTVPSLQIEKPFIFTLGTKSKRKNLDNLIKAFNIFKNETALPHKLVIAGSGKGIKSTSDVIVLDYISEQEKKYLYQNCEFFALPSLYEGFGLPVLEAMSQKIPVITSSVSSLPEVTSANALLVNPKNIREIATALKTFASDPELRKHFAEKCLSQSKKFTWENCAQETLKVLKEIA